MAVPKPMKRGPGLRVVSPDEMNPFGSDEYDLLDTEFDDDNHFVDSRFYRPDDYGFEGTHVRHYG